MHLSLQQQQERGQEQEQELEQWQQLMFDGQLRDCSNSEASSDCDALAAYACSAPLTRTSRRVASRRIASHRVGKAQQEKRF